MEQRFSKAASYWIPLEQASQTITQDSLLYSVPAQLPEISKAERPSS